MKKMKKLILFLTIILSIGITKANNTSGFVSYTQIHTVKSLFENTLVKSKWLKTDSVNVVFDFMDNNKITINDTENKTNTVFKIKSKKVLNFQTGDVYNMVGVDTNKKKYEIQVIFFANNNILLTVANEYKVLRYKIQQNS